MAIYKASKTQVPERPGWVTVFRHPVRKDKAGKVYRVRAGLGTRDEDEADMLNGQLNDLLQDESYWNLGARDLASRRFDKRVVDIFFDNMISTPNDPWEAREAVIPLPKSDSGYSRVRLIGQTGAGKTTLLRQLIGSDPKRDRFPSTSAAKATICDIEIVIVPDDMYKAVVTFMPQDLAYNYVKECVISAAVAAADDATPIEVMRKLLEHVEQRFRLSYILGSTLEMQTNEDTYEDNDHEEPSSKPEVSELSIEERHKLSQKLQANVDRIITAGLDKRKNVIRELGLSHDHAFSTEDQDAIQDLLEEVLQDADIIEHIVDDIMDDIEDRFTLLHIGKLERTKVGWPIRWSLESGERDTFLKEVNRFTSNYAPEFGRLLTPLVQGIRVQGVFRPTWYDGVDLPKLVLMDGEGLGHTPETVASISTSVTKSYEKADKILLVDNASQPLQGAAMSVLRSIYVSGHQSKLILAFTHFDLVTGDNIPHFEDRRQHVLNSLRSTINTLREQLDTLIARSLEHSLETKTFFLSRIQGVLPEGRNKTRDQLLALLEKLQKPIQPTTISGYHPQYDIARIGFAVRTATVKYQEEWRSRLLVEHWTRVKALSNHIARFNQDEYDTLKPVADLIRLISEQVSPIIMNPNGWHVEPTEEVRPAIIEQILRSISTQLHDLAFQRICQNYTREWLAAYELRGKGTTRVRSQHILNIYELAIPIPGETPRSESSQLLVEVRKIVKTAAETVEAEFI